MHVEPSMIDAFDANHDFAVAERTPRASKSGHAAKCRHVYDRDSSEGGQFWRRANSLMDSLREIVTRTAFDKFHLAAPAHRDGRSLRFFRYRAPQFDPRGEPWTAGAQS